MEREVQYNKKRITISIEEYLQRRQKKQKKSVNRNEEQKEENSAQMWAEYIYSISL